MDAGVATHDEIKAAARGEQQEREIPGLLGLIMDALDSLDGDLGMLHERLDSGGVLTPPGPDRPLEELRVEEATGIGRRLGRILENVLAKRHLVGDITDRLEI